MQRLSQASSELEERKHNLREIEECIEADPTPSPKLIEVRDFLVTRINSLESRLANAS